MKSFFFCHLVKPYVTHICFRVINHVFLFYLILFYSYRVYILQKQYNLYFGRFKIRIIENNQLRVSRIQIIKLDSQAELNNF